MELEPGSVRWLHVVVAALATFLLGGLWYTALFGKLWQRLHGYSDEKLEEMRKLHPPPVFFGVMLFSYLLLALVCELCFRALAIDTALEGAQFGFLLWLGVAFAIGLTAWIASDKPFGACALDLAYQLAFLVMTGAILAGWR